MEEKGLLQQNRDLENKFDLIKAAQTASHNGLCKHKSGNFSIFDREINRIYITPSAVDRDTLKSDDIIVVDLDGHVLENINGLKASSELEMHLAIYRLRTDVRGIAHTHSLYATSFAIAGKEIEPVAAEAYFYGAKTTLCPFFLPGTEVLARHAAASLQNADVCLLQNHGVVVVGKDIHEAVLSACYVEEVAQMYYNALVISGDQKVKTISYHEFEQFSSEGKA